MFGFEVNKELILWLACGYLAKKIFCFGVTFNDSYGHRYPSYNSYHVLDIRLYDGVTTDELVAKWAVLPTKASGLGNKNPQFTSLPDGKTLLIVGGVSSYTAEALAFNGETVAWDYNKIFKHPYERIMWVVPLWSHIIFETNI